jgi:hypothetical protein
LFFAWLLPAFSGGLSRAVIIAKDDFGTGTHPTIDRDQRASRERHEIYSAGTGLSAITLRRSWGECQLWFKGAFS